jgi:folate-binding Fe-S cluster repair protein YgfZ
MMTALLSVWSLLLQILSLNSLHRTSSFTSRSLWQTTLGASSTAFSTFRAQFGTRTSSSAPTEATFPSCFSEDIPVGLRKEAIENALSTRGICINTSKKMRTGVVHIKGKGCVSFLNNKFSNFFPVLSGQTKGAVKEACFLTSKGQVIDKLTIPYSAVNPEGETEAYLITSPDMLFASRQRDTNGEAEGSSSSSLSYLYKSLEPLIFPLDEVKITDMTSSCTVIGLSSTKSIDILKEQLRQTLSEYTSTPSAVVDERIPTTPGIASQVTLDTIDFTKNCRAIISCTTSLLPNCIAGYHVLIVNDTNDVVWNALSQDNPSIGGPLPIDALEYELLRIEQCVPAVGSEMMGPYAAQKRKENKEKTREDIKAVENPSQQLETKILKSSPLTLGLAARCVDLNKGCYLGQEGVSAQVKNPRGLPRQLYHIVFSDVSNDNKSVVVDNGDGIIEVLPPSSYPKQGDELFVLGSNEQIRVGVLTSVIPSIGIASANDTEVADDDEDGEMVLALALVRRPDSILSQMQSLDLEPLENTIDLEEFREEEPLHGLEVIVGGSFTIGRLQSLGFVRDKAFRDANASQNGSLDTPSSSVMGYFPAPGGETTASPGVVLDDNSQPKATTGDDEAAGAVEIVMDTAGDDDLVGRMMEEAKAAKEESEAAAVEAKRKAEKMKMLQARADAAMAARKAKADTPSKVSNDNKEIENGDESEAEVKKEAEEKRKAENIAMLKARTEAAMAARKKKKDEATEQ